MESIVYNTKGEETGKIKLPEAVFGLSWNADLVHDVALSYEANARTSIAHTKTRGEVSGTGKKPWKQKGTGRARHGSRRSPIWVGGGVAHGPRSDKDYSRKINKKAKVKALFTVLSAKLKEGEVLFVDNISIDAPKTKDAKAFLKSMSGIKGYETIFTKRKNAAYIAISDKNTAISKSFSNIGSIALDLVNNINVSEILHAKYVVFVNPEHAVKFLESKMTSLKAKTKEVKG